MRLVEAAEPMFARHETFHPRYGWFRKAYSFVAADRRVFVREDAPVRVGVGKNMVRAIRFWGLAAKLIEMDPRSSNRRACDLIPTLWAMRSLAIPGGIDTWKILGHYGCCTGCYWRLPPCCRCGGLRSTNFTPSSSPTTTLKRCWIVQLESTAEWASPHPSSVKKDVSALLRTYAPAEQSGRNRIEDILDCPLRELNLIGRSPATNRYRFSLGDKPALPPAILAYAILDYVGRADTRGNTITLGRLADEPGAPGKAFKLTEGELLAVLEVFIGETDTLALSSTAGAIQLSWSEKPRETATEILNAYYRSSLLPASERGMKAIG